MPNEKYYKLLGLNAGASSKDIRKRYRQLAMKYHPDRNSSPDAQAKFIALTEAYEVLLGKIQTPEPTPKTKQATQEERMQKARQRYARQAMDEFLENERYFNYLTKGRKWKTIRVGAFVGTFLTILIILDYFLPHHYEDDEVTHYAVQVGRSLTGDEVGLIKTRQGNYYWLSRMTYSLYGKTRRINVETTWIFHNPVRVISMEKIRPKYFGVHFSVITTAWAIILLFLLPLITIQFKRKTMGFTLLFHLSYFGTSAGILYFLITNDRWAHLLTLGFY